MSAALPVEFQSKQTHPRPGVPEQISTRVTFFIIGIAMAAWAPLIPYAKDRMGLEEGALGLLLLFLGMGSMTTMPLTGILTGRFGCRIVITVASLLVCLVLPLLATAANNVSLAIALFLFGALVGTIDVAVNIQAIIVEKASGRSMMSGFHGLFSLGGIIGAGGVSGLLALGLSPLTSVLCVCALIAALIGGFSKNLLGYGSETKDPFFVVPRGKVVFIGILCFIVFLAEGSVLDWSAIFLNTRRDLDPAFGGLGYAAFAVAMTIARFMGDKVVSTLGNNKVLLLGGLCAAAGFLLAVLIPSPITAIVGFALVGLGASNIVPVLFTAAGTQKAMPVSLAVSAVTTIGYAGILTGPAFIGMMARFSNLEVTFSMVAALLLVVAASAKPVTS